MADVIQFAPRELPAHPAVAAAMRVLIDATHAARLIGLDRDRFVEIAGSTWDAVEVSEASHLERCR